MGDDDRQQSRDIYKFHLACELVNTAVAVIACNNSGTPPISTTACPLRTICSQPALQFSTDYVQTDRRGANSLHYFPRTTIRLFGFLGLFLFVNSEFASFSFVFCLLFIAWYFPH